MKRKPKKTHFVHGCQVPGCLVPAVYGTGVSLHKNIPGHWYCRDHRPGKTAQGKETMDAGGQGRLGLKRDGG